MTKRIQSLFFCITLCCLVFPALLIADDGKLSPDPNGFKGYSWNTKVSQIEGLTLWGTPEEGTERKTYYLSGEPLRIGDIIVESILYSFDADEFKRVTIKYRDGPNYHALVAALTERFGTGKNMSRSSHDYTWVGAQTHMILRYDDQFDIGVLVVSQLAYAPR